jgi:hypothetical protein
LIGNVHISKGQRDTTLVHKKYTRERLKKKRRKEEEKGTKAKERKPNKNPKTTS